MSLPEPRVRSLYDYTSEDDDDDESVDSEDAEADRHLRFLSMKKFDFSMELDDDEEKELSAAMARMKSTLDKAKESGKPVRMLKLRAKRRVKSSAEVIMTRWDKRFSQLPYVHKDLGKTHYLESGGKLIYCTWCSADITVANLSLKSTSGNLRKHEDSIEHISFSRNFSVGAAADKFEADLRLGETPAGRKEREALERELRAITTAVAVAHGATPGSLHELYGGRMGSSIERLRDMKPPVFLGSSNSRTELDLDLAYVMLLDACKEVLKEKPNMYSSVATDGGQRRLGLRKKMMVTMLLSSELEKPILIDIALPVSVDSDGKPLTYDHAKCAADIKRSLDAMGYSLEQVVSLMGDNVAFNTALAGALGMMRGYCLAHAGALLAKCTKCLPRFKEIAITAGHLIFAGGTNKRAAALSEGGLDVNMLYAYTNRFASTIDVSDYIRTKYLEVAKFFTSSEMLELNEVEVAAAAAVDDDEVDDDDDDDDGIGAPGTRSFTKAKNAVAAAFSANGGDSALVMLHIVDLVHGKIPSLIASLSGEFDEVDPAICDKLWRFRALLDEYVAAPKQLVEQACARAMEQIDAIWSPTRVAIFCGQYEEKTLKMLEAMSKSFDKHFKPALDGLYRRFLYTIKNKPPTLEELGPKATNSLFGCKATMWGPEFRLEYKDYCRIWPTIKSNEVRSSAFWRSKEDVWPLLAPIARFWLEVPTSSISCERAIAKMRVFDTADRQRMKDATFKREMFFRCNLWVLEKVHAKTIAKYDALLDARRKAIKAPAPPVASAPPAAAASSAAAAAVIELD